uniref:HMG box domain-containing protein n=1 Tax=Oncorhynchus mykiss TaxID=8022 RepID=A0A8C7PBY2_ONCMY
MEKPQKPRSAYLLYYFDVHQTIQQEFPSLHQSEIIERISGCWKRLNVADKGYYLEKAKLEKEGTDTVCLPHISTSVSSV